MDITAASTERTIHIRICHHLWIRAFNMYIFKIPGFYECPISWVHFREEEPCLKKERKENISPGKNDMRSREGCGNIGHLQRLQ